MSNVEVYLEYDVDITPEQIEIHNNLVDSFVKKTMSVCFKLETGEILSINGPIFEEGMTVEVPISNMDSYFQNNIPLSEFRLILDKDSKNFVFVHYLDLTKDIFNDLSDKIIKIEPQNFAQHGQVEIEKVEERGIFEIDNLVEIEKREEYNEYDLLIEKKGKELSIYFEPKAVSYLMNISSYVSHFTIYVTEKDNPDNLYQTIKIPIKDLLNENRYLILLDIEEKISLYIQNLFLKFNFKIYE